jgi:2'-5' RNA ligase
MAPADDLAKSPRPFVLTLEMDGESFAAFDALRRRHIPPERNLVPAHVTLFHRLPGDRAREIKALLARTASGQKPIEIPAGEVKALERGVAIFLHSPQLGALREELAQEWWPWLGELDRAGFRPHVTIQTNVSEAEAHRTRQAIGASFRIPRIKGIGLHLWRYSEGPWEHEQLFRFR